ncbi:nucleoside/nucleotide kinase family protein [Microbacterium horticulturae]|uniref:Nucleoside/nucleotide kinase family protein n=1 Tax=Microbacterium horticulturae TaxID=3028316 RepID=A0ABY8BZ77_9MICO|nr:nucleoside/nucleotide kinase family protein [Microbacterium sp. KACC 23027]WEG08146.1 nucleoside/nucleotide kinase family protein [Microbacterium sp. KACC 23027]
MNPLTGSSTTFAELRDRAAELASAGTRRILGITGAPGAGKSTLAMRLVAALGPELAAFVPMDGYHLSNRVLEELGRRPRKGAFDTFDSWGYASLLERLHAQAAPDGDPVVYAPQFRRDLEEPVGSAIPVHASTPLIVTEGNYLLLDRDAWPRARAVIDEVWFLCPPEDTRLSQLIARHIRFGRAPDAARERSLGSDQRNAELITSTADRADLIVELADPPAELPPHIA